MEDKLIPVADAIISVKRIECLLDQLLIHTASIRFKDLPDNERKEKINQSFQYVDDDMKSYAESLKTAQPK